MNTRLLVTATLVFFVLAPPALAGSCGGGGTCRSSCASNEIENVAMASFCQLPLTPKCCVPTGSVCLAPGVCQSGPTADRPNLNPDPNINCGSTDRCYVPAPAPAVGNGGPTSPAQPSAGSTLNGGTNTSNSTLTGGTNTGSNSGTNVTLLNPLQGGTSLESFMLNILAFVIRIGSIIVIFMLIYVGYLFVIARGEPGKITEARQALLWTVIGALVLLGSKAIALGIEATVNALSVGQ